MVPPVSDDWVPVLTGESGAGVFRSPDGSRYAKHVGTEGAAALAAERDRTAWLGAQGVPGPRVLDWSRDETGARLETSAVVGVPADQVSAARLWTAWDGIADAVRRLHELPVDRCPFRQGLDWSVAVARDVVGRDAVNPRFLPTAQRRTPSRELLDRVEAQLDRRREQEAADLVVCHGDLCLPNIILNPRNLTVAGFVDLGRLGAADRHVDLALLLANSRETWPDAERAAAADAAFAQRYGRAVDADRRDFYLSLDPLTWG